MKLIKTRLPTLLRARFATVLDHLPSVPSVVLPIMSRVENDSAHLLLNLIFYGLCRIQVKMKAFFIYGKS